MLYWPTEQSGLINQAKYWQAVMLACEMGTQSRVCRGHTHKHEHTHTHTLLPEETACKQHDLGGRPLANRSV